MKEAIMLYSNVPAVISYRITYDVPYDLYAKYKKLISIPTEKKESNERDMQMSFAKTEIKKVFKLESVSIYQNVINIENQTYVHLQSEDMQKINDAISAIREATNSQTITMEYYHNQIDLPY